MKILMTGNPEYGIAKAFFSVYPDTTFVSRSNGFDLTKHNDQNNLIFLSEEYDVFINNSALHDFNQMIVLDKIASHWRTIGKAGHIICIGSTTDRTTKGQMSIYQQEKKALAQYCKQISLLSVWAKDVRFRTTLISFGSMATPKVMDKFGNDRQLIDLISVIETIAWVINSPSNLNVNEISVDPIQMKDLTS